MPLEDGRHAKPAPADHDIHDLLRQRFSARAYDSRPIAPDTLIRLLEAFRWAPSSFNEQPWRLVLTLRQDETEFKGMLGCLSESNRVWAERASVLALSVAKLVFDRNGRENRHSFHDVGLATAFLMVQATAMGIAVRAMAGFDLECARRTIGIPEGFEPVAMMAIGYAAHPETLDEANRQKELSPRARRPLDDLVFRNRWGVKLTG